MSAPDTDRWSTARIRAALRDKYCLPEFALLEEVSNGTGGHKSRSADALAMSCWPSRGLSLIGFEIKQSRQDWQKELTNPAKAEEVCKYCDYWYVAAGKGVIRDGELPPTWGLLEPRGSKLVVAREAPKLAAQPMSRAFLAALLRRTVESKGDRAVFDEEKRAATFEAYEKGKKAGEERAKVGIAHQLNELENLHAIVATFERETGLPIDRWDRGRKLSEAVRVVLSGRLQAAAKGMEAAEGYARDVIRAVEQWREAVRDLEEA